MKINELHEEFNSHVNRVMTHPRIYGVAIEPARALRIIGEYENELTKYVEENEITIEREYELVISHDPDGAYSYGDPRDDWGDGDPVLYVTRCSYHSTLSGARPTDRTAEAYLRFDEEYSNALEVTQRFENIFGKGRPVDLVTIYEQQNWLEVLVIGEPGDYISEFAGWWRNEFYSYELRDADTGEVLDELHGILVTGYNLDEVVAVAKDHNPELTDENVTVTEEF